MPEVSLASLNPLLQGTIENSIQTLCAFCKSNTKMFNKCYLLRLRERASNKVTGLLWTPLRHGIVRDMDILILFQNHFPMLHVPEGFPHSLVGRGLN